MMLWKTSIFLFVVQCLMHKHVVPINIIHPSRKPLLLGGLEKECGGLEDVFFPATKFNEQQRDINHGYTTS